MRFEKGAKTFISWEKHHVIMSGAAQQGFSNSTGRVEATRSRTGGRSTPPSVKKLLNHARRWLVGALTEEDRRYAAGLVRRLNEEFDALDFTDMPSLHRWRGSGATTRIFPTLNDYPNRTPKPLFLEDDVITYDLSRCYNKRFENMGAEEGRLLALRRLFIDPKKWLDEEARKKLRGVALVVFLRTVNATFPTEDALACLKNLKIFYTRFYGLCTPRKARRNDRSGGALHNIGLAARLQNTLYVVTKELEFRRGGGPNTVLMVQTDSITLRISDVKQHPVFGEHILTGSPTTYDDALAGVMSIPGVAEWKVEAKPFKAIMRGLAGKYAFLTTSVSACQDEQGWDEINFNIKTSPKNMLGDELKDAMQMNSRQARLAIMEAFEKGPSGFAEIVGKLPEKITRVNKHGKPYLVKPELRSLLAVFVPRTPAASSSSSSSSSSSAAGSRRGALDTAMLRAESLTKSTGDYHFTVALETNNRKRVYKTVTEEQRHQMCRGLPYHEVFTGFQRAFLDYDDETKELDPERVWSGSVSLRAFWKRHHGVDTVVHTHAMQCGSPIPGTPSFKRHIVFRVVDEASGCECVFADPKDIPDALGEELKKCVDVQPYAWKKCLRMPGSPGYGGKRAYRPCNSIGNLSVPSIYSNHCVCVSGNNTIVHGVSPKETPTSMGSDLFFPSETRAANLVFDMVRHMCPDHDVKVGSSSLDRGDPEAQTMWQRIGVKSNQGKLLDMTHFCEKLLVPVISGKKPQRKAITLKHKNGNNSWINFVFGLNEDVGSGYLRKVQFKVKGKQRKVLRNMLECELRFFHLHKIALVVFGASASASQWLNGYKATLAKERSLKFGLLSMDANGRRRKETCTLYEIRNAIRRRLRARRVRERVRLFKCKRSRGGASRGGLEKYQEDKTKYWTKNMEKIDASIDLGRVLGFVVSYCPTALANKVLEIETDHVTGAKPAWAANFYKYADLLRTSLAAKDDEAGVISAENNTNVLQHWVETVY